MGMEIAIAALLSVTISLGISIYVYKLIKDNNSWDKVRRYADKRTGDLDNLYKTVEDKFKVLISEFNAHHQQAAVALKLLKSQNDEFSEKIKTFDASINSVKKIEAEIDNYSRLLNDLNDMAVKVEENLVRIQNESTIVDRLSERLTKQDQVVNGIEKKIPELSDNFSKINGEQLKAIGTTLLDQYKSQSSNLGQEIKIAKDQAEQLLADLKDKIKLSLLLIF